MSLKTWALIFDGKTIREYPPSGMTISFPVGQGTVIDEVAYLVTKVVDGGAKVDVYLEKQDAHPELFCRFCGGSLEVTSDRPRCQLKRRGVCLPPKEEPKKQ